MTRPMHALMHAFRTAHGQGMNDVELARLFGVSRATIRYHRRLLRLPSNAPVGWPVGLSRKPQPTGVPA